MSEAFKDELPAKNHFERIFFNALKKKKDSFSPKELRFLQKIKKIKNNKGLLLYKKELESFNEFFIKYSKKRVSFASKKKKTLKYNLLRKKVDETILKDSKS